MAMMKGTLAGVALGALALATITFVVPIAAQGPGAPGPDRPAGPGMGPGAGPDMGPGIGPGTDRGGDMGMGQRGFDPNDSDITGPRGEVGFCQERLTRMAQRRLERIQRLVRPTDEQRAAFDELRMASAKAVETLRSACPGERPLTPPARMAAAEKWLEARLQAIKTVRPALDAFYRVLSDEQKIRWSMGSGFHGDWGGGGRWQMWGRPGPEDFWRDRQGWRGPWRDRFDQWQERGFDRRDRFGFDPRERFGQRWRDDDRDFGDDRWRDRERNLPPRWREQRERRTAPDEERL